MVGVTSTIEPAAAPEVRQRDDVRHRREAGGAFSRSSTRLLGLLVGVGVVFVLCLLSLAVGARPIALDVVIGAFLDHDPTDQDHLVVTTLRVPRMGLALLVGVALGLGGAVMQGVARNPLADPGILGVNAGAALFVVIAIAFLGVGSLYGYVWFAFAGAAVASVAVYAVGSLGREGATPVKLALAGAALTTFLGSITSALVITDINLQNDLRFWAVGSLAGRSGEVVAQLAPFIVVGAAISLLCAPALNALALGDDMARGLGQRVGLARGVSALAVVLLCGAATAAAGPIGFVGLVVPHVARLLTGPDYRWILPYSMVLAPGLMLIADTVGRVVLRPAELQAGIVTAAIGAPFFIWLVRRRDMAEL